MAKAPIPKSLIISLLAMCLLVPGVVEGREGITTVKEVGLLTREGLDYTPQPRSILTAYGIYLPCLAAVYLGATYGESSSFFHNLGVLGTVMLPAANIYAEAYVVVFLEVLYYLGMLMAYGRIGSELMGDDYAGVFGNIIVISDLLLLGFRVASYNRNELPIKQHDYDRRYGKNDAAIRLPLLTYAERFK